jgi:predicted  nucleic acid-binding Zn-ribbon protein
MTSPGTVIIAKHFCTNCEQLVRPARRQRDTGESVDVCPKCGTEAGERQSSPVVEQSQRVQPAKVPAKPAAPPDDVLAMAEARLAFVRERIDELRKYEVEAAMLERMVAAAKTEQ